MNDSPKPPADEEDWTLPPQISWGLAFLALILLPTASNLFQFLTGPREAYAELRLAVGSETYVIAKNSGAGQVKIAEGQLLRQVCLRFDGTEPFAPGTLGIVPATCYSIAVVSSPGKTKLSRQVLLDGEVGVDPYRLRLMTPVEETQILFGALVVLWMLITVLARLQRWYRDSDVAMTGKR
jgi:hypothetical protein